MSNTHDKHRSDYVAAGWKVRDIERPMMTPTEYGRLAFEAGKPCAPALDKPFIKRFCNGKVGTSLPALRAWQQGWIKASLAAPVPETEE